MVLPADSLCIGGFFSCLLRVFFPVIHFWAFVHQSSMFRVIDVLCAVSYTVAELRINGFFLSVCHFVYTYSSLSDPWCYL